MVIRSLGVGGAERQFIEFSTGLAGVGVNVIACVLGVSDRSAMEVAATSVRWVELGHAGPHSWPRTVLRLVRLLRRESPDIVYSFLPVSNVMVTIARALAPPIRHVWGVRAGWMPMHRYGALARFTSQLERKCSRFADLAVFNSVSGEQFHLGAGFSFRRRVVVANAIDIVRFSPDEVGAHAVRARQGAKLPARVMTIVGRLDPIKGHEHFIAAFARVREINPQVLAWVVGPGSDVDMARIQSACVVHRVLPYVRFFVASTDLPAVYSASDVVVSASESEGFPNVVCEALACGAAVVATDVGDSARIVEGVARVVAFGDDAAMAQAVSAAFEEREYAGAQRRRARIVDSFSKDVAVRQLFAELEQLLRVGPH